MFTKIFSKKWTRNFTICQGFSSTNSIFFPFEEISKFWLRIWHMSQIVAKYLIGFSAQIYRKNDCSRICEELAKIQARFKFLIQAKYRCEYLKYWARWKTAAGNIQKWSLRLLQTVSGTKFALKINKSSSSTLIATHVWNAHGFARMLVLFKNKSYYSKMALNPLCTAVECAAIYSNYFSFAFGFVR